MNNCLINLGFVQLMSFFMFFFSYYMKLNLRVLFWQKEKIEKMVLTNMFMDILAKILCYYKVS